MTTIKFTSDQLLLVLNYDTYQYQSLTFIERCRIHRVINGRDKLTDDLYKKIKDLLLKLKVNNYKKVFAYWQENKETTEKELIYK